ncbi:hypothetical protein HY490_05680 [Candidatus Woesearchaeota archaeon]|nr:hypothetical protein [Candidatus Woesearchaeota archaeon]
METILWALGITAGLLLARRVIQFIVIHQKLNQSYANDLNTILTSEECKVKGRFE